MCAFLVIGHYINPEMYPGSFGKFISNFSTYETTYNTEMWFLLPYSLLSLASVWLFRIYDRCNVWLIIIGTFFIHLVTSYGISRYADSFLYSHYYVYNLLLVLHILFQFTLGVMAARTNFFNYCQRRFIRLNPCFKGKGIIPWFIIFILVLINCVFKYNYLYSFLMITCFCMIDFAVPIKRILRALGKQSMNMWMVHTWLCYYLFRDFIYSFRYPVVIFVVLLLLSYFIGVVVDVVLSPIEKRFMSQTQRKEQIQI